MRILDIAFTNFCQHRVLRQELHPGMNAIVGPNGSGKSNVLKGIYGGLTNDFSRNEGGKDANVCQLAGPKDRSGVEIGFSHNDLTARVKRNLQPSSKSLQIQGEEKLITKDAEINQRILDLLGVNEQILDEYVFVDQWRMFSFLELTPAVRAEAFQRLFNTHKAEKIFDAIGEHLGKIEIRSYVEMIDEGVRRIAVLNEQINDAETAVGRYASLPTSMSDANQQDQDQIDNYSQASRLDTSVAKRRGDIASGQEKFRRAQDDLTAFREDEAIIAAGVDAGKEDTDKARGALASWQSYQKVQTARKALDQTIQDLLAEKVSRTPPPTLEQYVAEDDQDFAKAHQARHDQITRLQRFLAKFDPKKGMAECPECGTAVKAEEFSERYAEASRTMPVELARFQEDERIREESRKNDREHDIYETWEKGWEKRNLQAFRQREGLQSTGTTVQNPEAIKAAIVTHEESVKALQEIRVEIARLEQELQNLSQMIGTEMSLLQKEEADLLPLLLCTEASANVARQRIRDRAVQYQEKARLEGSLQNLCEQLAREEKDLEDNRNLEKSLQRQRLWKDHLEACRTVLHYNNLPRIVAHHYLEALQHDVNDFLEYFEAPFRITANADLSFDASFFCGPKAGVSHTAGRLSGGEKVVMAIAFRLSVNAMFAQEVGLLCLDEPTVGLDDHNLGCLEAALARLHELSRSRGLQVIMVTHERSMLHLFDAVIDLGVGESA